MSCAKLIVLSFYRNKCFTPSTSKVEAPITEWEETAIFTGDDKT